MTKKASSAILALALLGTGPIACVAETGNQSIGARQHRQRARIHEGVEDGDLTRREAGRLRERSRDIAEDRREALSDDGRLDRGERRTIRREQRDLNDDIHRERHDAQER